MVRAFHPHLVLRLLLLVFAFAQHHVECCDNDFKISLIQTMESLLDSKLDKLTVKIESKIELLELTVGQMKIQTNANSQSTNLELRAITSQLNAVKIELADGTATMQMFTNDFNSQLSELKIEQDNIGTKLNNVTLIQRKTSSDIKDITIFNGDLFRKLIDLDLSNFRTDHFWIHFNACPGGIFMGGQCFVVLATEKTEWSGAEAMCRASNLVLAEPRKGIDAPLRRYLHQTYDEGLFWVNGQQNGTLEQFVWRRSNQTLVDSNQLVSWLTEQPSYNNSTEFPRDFCVAIVAEEAHWMASPGIPYQPKECEQTQMYPICERLLQDTYMHTNPIQKIENNIYTKLETVRNNINTKQDDINTDTHTILKNIATKIGDVNNKQDEIKTDTHTRLEDISTKIGTVDTNIIDLSTYGLKFKIFTDVKRSWSESKEKCESLNSIMAEPRDDIAIPLRRFMLDNYGDGANVWLGAKSSDSSWRWNSGGSHGLPSSMSTSSPLWQGRSTANNMCLGLMVWESWWKKLPSKPYYDGFGCTNKWFTLCQARP